MALTNPGSAHEKYAVIYNYANDWLVYDYSDKTYVPYIKKAEKEFQAFSLEVNLKDYPKTFLVIKTPSVSTNVFVDNVLKRVSKKSEWLIYDMGKLAREYKKDKVHFSFFTTAEPDQVVAYIGYPFSGAETVQSKTEQKEIMKLLPRSASRFTSGIALAFLIGVIITSFISTNYIRVYQKYYSFKDVISTKVKDDLFMIGKPLDRPSLLFVILLSAVLGFIVLLLQSKGYIQVDNSFIFQSGDSFAVYVINFFKICLLIFGMYIVKYFFINLIGKLFNLVKVTDIHFFKVIQYSLFFSSLLVLLFLVMHNTYFPFPSGSENYILLVLIVFFALRFLLVYFSINRESNVKFLYLFSYLCIAEALPTILLIKFLF